MKKVVSQAIKSYCTLPAFMMVVVVKADTKMSSRSFCVYLPTRKKSQNTKFIFLNPYHANIFVLKMSSAVLDCSYGSSLIWGYIVCNIGYQSLQANERADENFHVWPEKS